MSGIWKQDGGVWELASPTGFDAEAALHDLNPRVVEDSSGFVTIWNENGPYLTVWRKVFERRGALQSLQHLEELLAPNKVGQSPITPELLGLLTDAYREAPKP
ncbi:MAG: hypothetical protein ACRDZ4_13600 [Egibacteraceae bacterium]